MANWVADFLIRNPDMAVKPVSKRATHGLHFDLGGNEKIAYFTGNPIHYLDGGVYKPIDTKLLTASGGFYGCPHSDVLVHPDGRVKIIGSDYQQYTELPGAPVGSLDGDRIVRTFANGRHIMRVVEDGYREEIILDSKPPLSGASASKYIAQVTGSYLSKYQYSGTVVTDANNNFYVFDGNVNAFRSWMDNAVYPVVIDPDFGPETAIGDNMLIDWAGDNNRGTLQDFALNDGICIFRFDLSSISSLATCNSASLKVTKTSDPQSSYAVALYVYAIASANGDWVEGTATYGIVTGASCWNYKAYNTVNWAGSAGLGTAGTDYINTNLVSINIDRADAKYTEYNISFNSSGISAVEDWFGVTTNPGFRANLGVFVSIGSSEKSTTSYRPYLTVNYTAPPGNPNYAYAQQ